MRSKKPALSSAGGSSSTRAGGASTATLDCCCGGAVSSSSSFPKPKNLRNLKLKPYFWIIDNEKRRPFERRSRKSVCYYELLLAAAADGSSLEPDL
jgi:hypothetical protein